MTASRPLVLPALETTKAYGHGSRFFTSTHFVPLTRVDSASLVNARAGFPKRRCGDAITATCSPVRIGFIALIATLQIERLLCSASRSTDQATSFEQIASRQELVTNSAVVTIATRLYVDTSTNSPKRGAGGKSRGAPRRLADILNQFDVTWDLYYMSAEDLLGMLPEEFDRFRTPA
jgi:hypothetical protein